MIKTIIFDIDGTLADCEHRRHYVRDGNKNWKAFNESMHLDKPIQAIVDLMKVLNNSMHRFVLVTGRSEEYRNITIEWLIQHNIYGYFERLYMRATKDYRSDVIVKQEILEQIKKDGFDPWLAIDDRKSVVAMWRANGITCLQCAEGDF